MPHNKQLQRTVRDKVPRHIGQRVAAELRRYAARFVVAVFSLIFSVSGSYAAEPLVSVRLVNSGAVLDCDYMRSDDEFTLTCRDAYAVFALRCTSVAWSELSVQRADQQEFLCPVSAERSALGNALRLRCTKYDAFFFEQMRTAPNPRALLEGRIPTHHCDSEKADVE